ncbi:GNAT family N-acetyltransferase [Heyndrickxia oleronia]|jgi:ribosomal protein S18 acetylase RimI-like enzyme|uniref:GNAT family N-acetyltransferase n=1 Tax=Heyndrickxia oleronia TaxID=38875 RepID=UPI00242CA9AC|nr:GNAT family N-acetyltransferase [Heyndrickxia oleronia]MCI1615335.1 GNAT family N-acetyltransferase [Heyndrickxia oleronia]MCI1746110.1 GNAT family N-acetyltransferase [Heyndrickxia oleronia]
MRYKLGGIYVIKKIDYTTQPPGNFEELLNLYESLGWNSLKLTVNDLERMCKQSWYAVYAFDKQQLVGMGRVIYDGVITAIICGVCVLPSYQSQGIGKEILNRITNHCEQNKVIPQLLCVESLESYYKKIGFKKFSVGMTKNINR